MDIFIFDTKADLHWVKNVFLSIGLDGVDRVESISDLSNKNFLVKRKPFKPVW